jgi:hypothetical protein
MTDLVQVPTEAVEAAARAMFERIEDYVAGGWHDIPPEDREPLRIEARAALEAALPHLRAQWLAEAEAALRNDQAFRDWWWSAEHTLMPSAYRFVLEGAAGYLAAILAQRDEDDR